MRDVVSKFIVFQEGIEDLRQRISEESIARMNAEKRVAEVCMNCSNVASI